METCLEHVIEVVSLKDYVEGGIWNEWVNHEGPFLDQHKASNFYSKLDVRILYNL